MKVQKCKQCQMLRTINSPNDITYHTPEPDKEVCDNPDHIWAKATKYAMDKAKLKPIITKVA